MRNWLHSPAVRLFSTAAVWATLGYPAVVLDRIAVVVGKHVIKTSDIDRDLRVTEFINQQGIDFGTTAKHQSAERLIDQELIRDEIITGSYRRPPDSEAEGMEQQLVRDRFGGSETRFRRELADYGLTGEQLRSQLLWQLTVLRFIDQRFRVGVYVADQEVRDYYDQHLTELRKQYPANSSFDALKDKLREQLEGERINANFSTWLQQARGRSHIEYRQEAFV